MIILVPENMKLPDGKEPRQIADEGFFVGKKPFISRSNINRMENRFVTQKVEYCHEQKICSKNMLNHHSLNMSPHV